MAIKKKKNSPYPFVDECGHVTTFCVSADQMGFLGAFPSSPGQNVDVVMHHLGSDGSGQQLKRSDSSVPSLNLLHLDNYVREFLVQADFSQ